jgi:hypothetical protein
MKEDFPVKKVVDNILTQARVDDPLIWKIPKSDVFIKGFF